MKCRFCQRERDESDLASMNDHPYCHGKLDSSPTCYQLRQWRAEGVRDVEAQILGLRRDEAVPAKVHTLTDENAPTLWPACDCGTPFIFRRALSFTGSRWVWMADCKHPKKHDHVLMTAEGPYTS